MQSGTAEVTTIGEALEVERERLVRYCARTTGNRDAAEDLAQETLLEAWRSLDRLRDADGLTPWLRAIARHVCLRWCRARGKDVAHVANERRDDAPGVLDAMPSPDPDPLLDLEREELATLLDRALRLLPLDTREALVASYVHERPQAELAAQLRLSEGALRVRLHRGKLALRQILATDLRAEVAGFGVGLPVEPAGRATRIWCPFCGSHHVRVVPGPDAGHLEYRCAGACVPGGTIAGRDGHPPFDRASVERGTSPKAVLRRTLLALDGRYRRDLRDGVGRCVSCGAEVPVRLGRVTDAEPTSPFSSGLSLHCPRCSDRDAASLGHLLLDLPAAQRFWRRHPRMRALPLRAVEHAGRPSLIGGFESVADHTRLEVISDRETYAVLGIAGEPA